MVGWLPMKSIEKKLCIHDILKLKIVYPKKEPFIESINFPFRYFEKEYDGEPEIIFNFGPLNRKKTNCDIVFRNTEISKNYIYYKKKNNGSSYEVEIITDSQDNVNINFNWIKRSICDTLFPYYRPQLLILEPIIEYKLLLKGWILLHGACIAKEDGASIFVGRSGSYKSPITKICLKKFCSKYIGDDKILIKDNYAYSFPKNLSLFEYEMSRSHQMVELNKKTEKLHAIIYSMRNKNNSYLEVKEKEKINSIFLVLKSNQENNEIQLEDITNEMLFDSLTYNNYSEFWNYYDIWDHFIAYSYVYTDFPFSNYINILNKNIQNNLKKIGNLYQITISNKCDESSIENFLKENWPCL